MATVNLNTVRQVIESRVATELASSPAISVVFANMPFEPTINSSFVQCLVNFTGTNFINVNTNAVTGLITFNTFTKAGVGAGANLVIAKRLRDLFTRQIVSDVFFDNPTGPTLLQSTEPEGYFQSVLTVEFEIFENI